MDGILEILNIQAKFVSIPFVLVVKEGCQKSISFWEEVHNERLWDKYTAEYLFFVVLVFFSLFLKGMQSLLLKKRICLH